MDLPNSFQFSQSSLHDFDVCARRFKLRYLDRLRWPAIESEPVREAERLAQLGADFHRLVHQHLLGLDADVLAQSVANAAPELQQWWQSYRRQRPPALDQAEIYPELTLSAPLGGYRLLARFDLLAVARDGAFLIIDWKTSQRQPARDLLARRLQSRVYPFVLAAAGAAFNNGQAIDPAAIKMIYWYARFPDAPEIFEYSRSRQNQDEQFLSELIERIKRAAEQDDFPLVADDKPCTYCIYRSVCDRGQVAGSLADALESPEDDVDLVAFDWD